VTARGGDHLLGERLLNLEARRQLSFVVSQRGFDLSAGQAKYSFQIDAAVRAGQINAKQRRLTQVGVYEGRLWRFVPVRSRLCSEEYWRFEPEFRYQEISSPQTIIVVAWFYSAVIERTAANLCGILHHNQRSFEVVDQHEIAADVVQLREEQVSPVG
jgi:hypothetical protein